METKELTITEKAELVLTLHRKQKSRVYKFVKKTRTNTWPKMTVVQSKPKVATDTTGENKENEICAAKSEGKATKRKQRAQSPVELEILKKSKPSPKPMSSKQSRTEALMERAAASLRKELREKQEVEAFIASLSDDNDSDSAATDDIIAKSAIPESPPFRRRIEPPRHGIGIKKNRLQFKRIDKKKATEDRLTECPMCGKGFGRDVIEEHASTCE